MYVASDEFHAATYSVNPPSRILVSMPDISLDAADLIASGLTFTEAVNNDEELTIGSCSASTIDFTVRNDHGLLSDYPFSGECDVRIAIRTRFDETRPIERPYAILRYGEENELVFRGSTSEPYVTVNGYAPTIQPPFPVHALMIDENRVYCVAENGDLWGFMWKDGRIWSEMTSYVWGDLEDTVWDSIQGVPVPLTESVTWNELSKKTWDELDDGVTTWAGQIKLIEVHPFMRLKLVKWAKEKRGLWHSGKYTYEFSEQQIDIYEYVPLGKFIPDKPEKRRVVQIDFTASDRMVKFDVSATAFLKGLSYPLSLGDLFIRLCSHVGVPRATTTFMNSARLIDAAPFDPAEEELTCREVLTWIAEAACAFGRMTRDGEIELTWFGTHSVDIPMTQYFDIDITEHTVTPISQLHVLIVGSETGITIGSGSNTYQIVDNPYIANREMCVPIYTRLSTFGAFHPIEAYAVCDWSIQAGDVIAITLNNVKYTLPVYRQVIEWNGGSCRVTYESTGALTRPVADSTSRKSFSQKQIVNRIESEVQQAQGDIAELKITTNSISIRVSRNETNISELRVTANQISARVEDTEKGIAELRITADGISTEVKGKVGYTEVISSINQTAEQITINASKINFNGAISANGTFQIDTSGYMRASGGTIGGWTISGNSLVSNGQGSISSGTITGTTLYGTAIYGSAGIYMGYNDGMIDLYAPSLTPSTVSTPSVTGSTGSLRLTGGGYVLSIGGGDVGSYPFSMNSSLGVSGVVDCTEVISGSDSRLKRNIQNMTVEQAVEYIRSLNPVTFKYLTGDERVHNGLIAQEAPEQMRRIGANGYFSLAYNEVLAPLIKSVQHIMEVVGIAG